MECNNFSTTPHIRKQMELKQRGWGSSIEQTKNNAKNRNKNRMNKVGFICIAFGQLAFSLLFLSLRPFVSSLRRICKTVCANILRAFFHFLSKR